MSRAPAMLAVLVFLLSAPLAVVGQTAQPAPSPQPLSGEIMQGFESLGRRAAFHTDFTFDRSMLQVAGYFIGDTDQNVRNAIAKLDSITVHSYHFAAPGLYDPAALDVIRRQYQAAGWRHLVAAHGRGDPFDQGQTDLWINFAHMDVTGMMVLITQPKDIDLIALDGDLSTVDLLHLRGHFGIPRFSGDGFVPPGSAAAARQPYVAPAPDTALSNQGPEPSQEPSPGPPAEAVGVGVGSPELEAAPPPPTPPGL